MSVHGDVELGEGIDTVRVAPELRDEDLRLEGPQHGRDDGVEGSKPTAIARTRWERDVDRHPLRVASPRVLGEAGSRERGVAALVQADRHHSGVVVERSLHAVAVVGVHVDVRHPTNAVGEQPRDGDGDVVVHAEP